jgi:hypothetical protein
MDSTEGEAKIEEGKRNEVNVNSRGVTRTRSPCSMTSIGRRYAGATRLELGILFQEFPDYSCFLDVMETIRGEMRATHLLGCAATDRGFEQDRRSFFLLCQ